MIFDKVVIRNVLRDVVLDLGRLRGACDAPVGRHAQGEAELLLVVVGGVPVLGVGAVGRKEERVLGQEQLEVGLADLGRLEEDPDTDLGAGGQRVAYVALQGPIVHVGRRRAEDRDGPGAGVGADVVDLLGQLEVQHSVEGVLAGVVDDGLNLELLPRASERIRSGTENQLKIIFEFNSKYMN